MKSRESVMHEFKQTSHEASEILSLDSQVTNITYKNTTTVLLLNKFKTIICNDHEIFQLKP